MGVGSCGTENRLANQLQIGRRIVGIDVFHSKSAKAGSIAGMVSSINESLSRYYSSVVIQKQGQEIIDALKIAFLQSLIRYHDANNCFPEVVVVFRDGVGDSQMNTVAAHEGQQFMNAFKVSSDSGSDSDSDSDSSSSGDSDELRKRSKGLQPSIRVHRRAEKDQYSNHDVARRGCCKST